MTRRPSLGKKAQLSVEIIIILSALLIIVMAILSSFSIGPEKSYLNKRSMSAREYAETLSYSINNIYLAGDGAAQPVELPSTLIDNTNYSIQIYPSKHLLEITWPSRSGQENYLVQLLTSNISGDTAGLNGQILLKNINGEVVIDD